MRNTKGTAKEDYAAARSTLKQARRQQDKQKFEQLSARLDSLDALASPVGGVAGEEPAVNDL